MPNQIVAFSFLPLVMGWFGHPASNLETFVGHALAPYLKEHAAVVASGVTVLDSKTIIIRERRLRAMDCAP
jgi:hypothetical protein